MNALILLFVIFTVKQLTVTSYIILTNKSIAVQKATYLSNSIGNNNDADKYVLDDNENRKESVKTALSALVIGSIISLPLGTVTGIMADFNADWEFAHDSQGISLALFGIVYRYCVRKTDNNPMISSGVSGAFAIVRALGSIHPPSSCSSLPINCGSPFYLFTIDMLTSGLSNFTEGIVCFYGTSVVLEVLFSRGYLKKM